MSRLKIDKGELLRKFLEERTGHVPPGYGYRKMRCINPDGHTKGDQNPSASANFTTGYYHCFACGLSGDALDLIQTLDGLTFSQALTTLGGAQAPSVEEPTWI